MKMYQMMMVISYDNRSLNYHILMLELSVMVSIKMSCITSSINYLLMIFL